MILCLEINLLICLNKIETSDTLVILLRCANQFCKVHLPVFRPRKNVYFPASKSKFPSSLTKFPSSMAYVFLYFLSQNHKISLQGASWFAFFSRPACILHFVSLIMITKLKYRRRFFNDFSTYFDVEVSTSIRHRNILTVFNTFSTSIRRRKRSQG